MRKEGARPRERAAMGTFVKHIDFGCGDLKVTAVSIEFRHIETGYSRSDDLRREDDVSVKRLKKFDSIRWMLGRS